MKSVHTLIIGAGISGLTYGAYTKEDFLIVEKEEKCGGLCRTFYKDGFIWDYAGHFFHFAHPEIKQLFEQQVGTDDLVKCNKCTNINYEGTVIDYPFQMNIHQLPKDEFIDCLYDLFNRCEKEQYENFEEMLYGKFGKGITEKFLKPYNEKLYACKLNDLDPKAMGRFFPYANPTQIINNMKRSCTETYNSTFEYPKKGAQFFVDVLLNRIPTDKILINATVQKINLDTKVAIVNGEEYKYEKLVNTIPLNEFLKLCSLDEPYIKDLGSNKVLVFNLGFDKKAVNSKIHWTYFPDKRINFYRVGFYNNILNSNRLSLYVEIGYRQNELIDEKQQLKITLENLKKVGIITDHELIANNTLIINPGYVHITSESIRTVKKIKQILCKNNAYTIGRYGGWTYCSIEDCMIEAMNLAKESEK